MTVRPVAEWIGKSSEAVPPRVRVRVFEAANGRCAVCSRKITASDTWQADHIVALINGGENRERNLQCLCGWCHKAKTRADVAEKSVIARSRAKHLGIRKPSRLQGRPFPKSEPQHSATSPVQKRAKP